MSNTKHTPAAQAVQFLSEFRGVPAPDLAKALNRLTSGVRWNGSAKKHMADSWADGYHFVGRTLEDVRTALQVVQQPTLDAERQAKIQEAVPDLLAALRFIADNSHEIVTRDAARRALAKAGAL